MTDEHEDGGGAPAAEQVIEDLAPEGSDLELSGGALKKQSDTDSTIIQN